MVHHDSDVLSALLEKALALPPEARAEYLDDACAGNPHLRGELSSLLSAHEASSGYFERLNEEIVAPALAALARECDELPIGQTIAQYRILEKLARGGMGVVFKALDLTLDRFVALKFLPAHLSTDSSAKARFISEAKAASAIDHPNIGVVHEIRETEAGRLFMVMGYYEGETLDRRNESGPLSFREALDVAGQIASALAAAHRKGIIHRDVKPSNILVTPDGTAKLLDFGIAKLSTSDPTKEGTAVGTVPYMSPEQTYGKAIDHRTDLWSLGIVLYELLTGVRPFRADNEEALIYSIRHDEWESPDRMNPEIPRAASQILRRCLAKDPGGRYGQAEQLLADLRALAEGGIPPSSAVSTRWRLLGYGGAAGLIGLLAAGALYYFERRSGRETPERVEGARSHRKRLAVLPLAVFSSDPEETYLADGMTAELIAQLSKIRGLRVIARSSVLPYKGAGKGAKEIGRELAVGTLLEGSVRKSADQVQIRLQLADAESQEELWTEDYVVDVGNLAAVPREIAQRVAENLRIELEANERRQLSTPGTSNSDAYKLYLKGRHLLDKADQASARQAREYFQEALDLDPTFAQGWTGLGDAYAALGVLAAFPAADAYPRTRAAAERALKIDPDLPEAHVSLGTALSYFYWEFETAAHHYRRAIELNPSYAEAHRLYAEYLRYRGRFDEALGEARQAEELDPLSPGSQLETGIIVYLARRYDDAVARFRRLLDINPRFTYAYFFLALAHVQKREFEKALATLDQMVAAGGRLQDVDTLRAMIHAFAGRRAAAWKEIERVNLLSREEHVSPWHPAMIHLALGEHDRALDLLEQAYRDRDWRVRLLPVEPLFDPLRTDPRFTALAARLR